MCVSPEEYAMFLKDFDDIVARCKVVTLSGSLPRGLPRDTYAALIARGKSQGCKMMLDTSGATLTAALESKPYYVKPNEDELKALVGCSVESEAQVAQAALRLHRQGVENVVVSMGSRGALLAGKHGVMRGVPPKIQAVNTVGCGDSMTAAFAVATVHEMPADEALRYAVAISAASALSADTGGLDIDTYKALMPQVQVYSL